MSHRIITIGRQFGSGGRQLGQRLSQELHIPMYDRELVEMAADKLGLSPVSIEKVDESALNTFLATYQLPLNTGFPESYGLPLNDTAYLAQSSIIETLAKRGSCIIIGRCGDYVLRDNPDCINVFICASMEDRKKRIMERYHMKEREAVSAIKSADKRRKNYYETYTGRKWGSIDSHQILLNISLLGEDKAAYLIRSLYEAPAI